MNAVSGHWQLTASAAYGQGTEPVSIGKSREPVGRLRTLRGLLLGYQIGGCGACRVLMGMSVTLAVLPGAPMVPVSRLRMTASKISS